jgi:hypothetical protein
MTFALDSNIKGHLDAWMDSYENKAQSPLQVG